MKKISNTLLIILTLGCFSHPSLAQEPGEIPGEIVVFKSGDNVLEGKLVLPDSAENAPVLVFMGGMYDWGDPHPQRHNFIRENLTQVFPKAGIGVLFYSPRGVGNSDGRWGRATLPDFADDAEAAIRFLQQRKDVDPNRIGIIGQGEDGWVAQIVAARNPQNVKIMASLAGPTFSPTRYLINRYHSEYVCNGEDPEQALLKAEQKAVSHQNWVSVLPLTRRWRHMNMIQGFNPEEYISQITIPSLFVFGENDGEVYPGWATDSLQAVFPEEIPQNMTVQTVPNANRYFHVVEPCFSYEDERIDRQQNFSFRFKEILQNWVFGHL